MAFGCLWKSFKRKNSWWSVQFGFGGNALDRSIEPSPKHGCSFSERTQQDSTHVRTPEPSAVVIHFSRIQIIYLIQNLCNWFV